MTNPMTGPEGRRFYVIAPDAQMVAGFGLRQAAEAAALAYGTGAHLVDTESMPYEPMAERVENGELVYAPFGAWDTRGGADRNLIEAVKKGYVPLVQAFLAKGADADARDGADRPALNWAVARGSAGIVQMLLAAGADRTAADAAGMTALKLAESRGHGEIAEMLR